VMDAFAEPGNIKENGLLAFLKCVLFPLQQGPLVVKRLPKHGGDVTFNTYEELEQAYAEKKLYPLDLKGTVAELLNNLLAPIRKIFSDPALIELTRKAYPNERANWLGPDAAPLEAKEDKHAKGKEKGVAQGKAQPQPPKGGKQPQQSTAPSGSDAFYQLDIRVGKIVKAWKHPDADRLYVEQIDLGESEPRQVCSGLVEHIPLDQFQGSDCLVIVNLKPAEMKKVMSNGMVLAAKGEGKIELVKPPPGTPVGSRVYLQGDEDNFPAPATEVDGRNKKSAWATVAPGLKTNADGIPVFEGKPLVVKSGPAKSGISNGVVS